MGRPETRGSAYADLYTWGMPSAPHIGHSQHLCDMVGRGEVTLEQVKEIVKDATYICKTCGRVAAKESNLCEPEALE